MKDLTLEACNKFVENTRLEWDSQDDWWSGSDEVYSNAKYGFDVNIFSNEFGDFMDGIRKCVFYRAKKAEDGSIMMSCDDEDKIMEFFVREKRNIDSSAENVHGIKYSYPEVILIKESGIGVSEIAARTCYDSFGLSENEEIKAFDKSMSDGSICDYEIYVANHIDHSNLLDELSWTYFHHSILEHATLSFLVRGVSRGVLQEHARHRIQAISVRSTRYTMSSLINAFACSASDSNISPDINFFVEKVLSLDMFVTSDDKYNRVEAEGIFSKLSYQLDMLGREEFLKKAVAKSSIDYINSTESKDVKFKLLQDGKKKRNVGDAFKHVVSDNWKVDMVVTFNLRSLKNYFGLRDSGSAFFQIQWLAKKMKSVTPKKYLDLIVKSSNKDK